MPAIDLSHRIIQSPPAKPKPSSIRWGPWRRLLQLLCGVLLIILPLTNGLRLDVRRGLYYFAWHRMMVHDQVLLFWILTLGVWGLITASFLYGRLWCGWVCPQTITSDFADSLKRRLDRAFRARRGTPAYGASRFLWTAGVAAASVAAGGVTAMYWLAPGDVVHAALNPGLDPAGAGVVYGIAAVLAADMLWIRRRFCSHICPYGPLLGIVGDKNTLAVRYLDERDDDCIRCGKCVVDCPMGIDIKQGVSQHDCIGCGECVDSCNDVLGKRGIPGLIEYRYGTEPERAMPSLSKLQRAGLWDAYRWAVLGVFGAIAAVVGVLLFARWPLTASIDADGAVARSGGLVTNGYSLTVKNNSPDEARFTVSVAGLQGAALSSTYIDLAPRAERTIAETVSEPAAVSPPQGARAPIRIIVTSGSDIRAIDTFFYSPRPGE